ncbi:site-specific integrase [Lapillicoccus sp.]|uniref:tyrosine-type recombinase/integrase n=1 Tax=Lapillicoccus sp. TaxID=1909287 RepID=UPI0025CE9020|nr:site-specific integrase [Lapillicoccus sp.]
MANIQKHSNGRWKARYRDAAGKEHARHFTRKVDAQRWLDDVTSAVVTGTYTDPGSSRVTVSDWSTTWLAGQVHLKATGRSRVEGIVRNYITPRWGSTKLRDISHAEVQAWVTELMAGGLSASSVQRAHGILSQMLDLAVRDRRLPTNPAKGARLPRKLTRPRRFLTAAQVEALVLECEPYGLVVRFLAYTGLRWGEMAALRVRDVDPLRRRMHIARSVTEDNGRLIFDTTKTGEERTVPLPRFLAEQVTESVAGKGPDDLVFEGTRGGVLRNGNFNRRTFGPAARAIGEPDLTPHGLRHTAASLAIAAGGNVKVVQQMLGHATASMTLDLYGHLFPDQLDDVADRLDVIGRAAALGSCGQSAVKRPTRPLRATNGGPSNSL